MTSAAPHPADRPVAAGPGPALAYTPEQAAAIIGGNCKAYLLKQLAREKKIPALKIGGAWNFTSEQISAAVAYFAAAALGTQAPAAAAKRAKQRQAPQADTLPFPSPGVTQLRARVPRKRGAA